MQSAGVDGAGGAPQPGQVLLGKYRIERVIGIGGMGAVVAARHLQLDEQVAIKFLLPEMLQHDEVVQRFLREAKAAIKIRSEHCVRVLDVGQLDTGAPYMVMEFLQGQDLAAVVTQYRPLPVADVVDWVLQACEALAEAHALGIVHRDLKPANLFLTRRADGTPSVKVLDFGISKQAASGADAGVTKTQAILGSPRYMSPEQMRSTRDVDARADVWSLGAVVHELIAGQPPFDAETMTALCAAILQDPPRSLRASREDVPAALEAVVLGALEKARDRRYPTVAHFAHALAPFGSPAAHASAERVARVLGIAGAGRGLAGSGAFDARPSGAMYSAPSPAASSGAVHAASAPMAATTGGSGSVAGDATRRPSSSPAIAVGIGAAVILLGLGAAGLVALKHRPTAAAALPPPAADPPPGLETATPTPTPALAPAPASASALAPASAPSSAPSPVRPSVPSTPPARRPGTVATPPAQKPPSNNPFGDDRKG